MIVCSRCGHEVEETAWKCVCGGPVEVLEEQQFDVRELKGSSLWRYQPYLGTEKRVSFDEGHTPFVFIDNCYYKLDFFFPTGSFKDRGSTVMMSVLHRHNIPRIVEDSSGNAGASIAAYAARAGITAEIYVPAYASQGKVFQIEAFGADMRKVEGTREDTRKEALKRAETVYYASHQWNPWFLQGMKTIAYEIGEQLDWDVPDVVVVPVGSGSLYYGAYLGFKHLYESDVIERIPNLVGVQPEVCSPVYNALYEKERTCEKSVAEGLLVEHPPRLQEILKIVRQNGELVVVSEKEIAEGLKKAVSLGLFIEPTSASVMAALRKVDPSKSRAAVLTGSGLKATREISDILNKRM
ncbi:MAG: pyridoxal-phosphate dependent enzyme [Theionarchaea archaeon]|nr:pyridoxal-phosphate dependent enzyme [Theionarchaea archaeon]MBU7036691.1 pyridoxal-phosphate dependent enzyme [Theionarchaea archaeon]